MYAAVFYSLGYQERKWVLFPIQQETSETNRGLSWTKSKIENYPFLSHITWSLDIITFKKKTVENFDFQIKPNNMKRTKEVLRVANHRKNIIVTAQRRSLWSRWLTDDMTATLVANFIMLCVAFKFGLTKSK